MTTIRDVARLAEVSVATASKVVNKKGSVSEKLTQRVLSAMEALDYRPNEIARSLKVQRSQTIGMVVPDVTNVFFTDVIRGVETEARGRGYSLILCDSNEEQEVELVNLNTLIARRVDGVLVSTSNVYGSPQRGARRRFPVVYYDRVPPGFMGSAVVIDNLGAAYEAARHLLDLGHRRLAIITGRLNLSNGRERLEGFRKALQQAGLPLREEYLQLGDFLVEGGYRCGMNLLRLAVPPTAIFSCNNQLTLGLMRAVSELGLDCPRDVSILGFDDFDWAANFRPRLTTVAQPSLEMGKQAAQMLLRKIECEKDKDATEERTMVVLKAELRVRDSTAPPSQLDVL